MHALAGQDRGGEHPVVAEDDMRTVWWHALVTMHAPLWSWGVLVAAADEPVVPLPPGGA